MNGNLLISNSSTNNDTGYEDEEQRNSILSIQTLPTTLIISNTTVSLQVLALPIYIHIL